MSAPVETFVPKILGEYFRTYRTGVLTLKKGSIVKTIYFNSGNIVSAGTNLPDEKLDERLIEWNILNRNTLRRAIDEAQQRGISLSRALLVMNFMSEDKLKELFARHILEIIYSTFSWQSPETKFETSLHPS
jgi:hypothetical protein